MATYLIALHVVRPGVGANGEVPSVKRSLVRKDLIRRSHRLIAGPDVPQVEGIPADDIPGSEKVVAVKSILSILQPPQERDSGRLPQEPQSE